MWCDARQDQHRFRIVLDWPSECVCVCSGPSSTDWMLLKRYIARTKRKEEEVWRKKKQHQINMDGPLAVVGNIKWVTFDACSSLRFGDLWRLAEGLVIFFGQLAYAHNGWCQWAELFTLDTSTTEWFSIPFLVSVRNCCFYVLFACYLLEEPSQPTTDDEHSTRTAPTLEPRSNDLEQNCLRWFVLLLGVPKPPYIRTQHKIFVPTMYLHDAYILQCTVWSAEIGSPDHQQFAAAEIL